jgi:HEAT repeat protein
VGIAYDQLSPPRKKPDEEYLASLSLEDLFSLVDASNCIRFSRVLREKVSAEDEEYLLQQAATGNPNYMILAFRGLGELGTPRAFEALKSFIETSENADRKTRRYAFEAFGEIPGSLTLSTARQWFRRKEWYLQVAAGDVLERHATPADVPLLSEALRMPETVRCEDFRLSSALNAFARLDGLGWIPELQQVFCQTQSSYRRCDAANAMAGTAPVSSRPSTRSSAFSERHCQAPSIPRP